MYEESVRRWLEKPPVEKTTSVPIESDLFQKAIDKFPASELERDKKIVREHGYRLSDIAEDSNEFKLKRVRSRWENPICGNCKSLGGATGKLYPCLGCGLVFYCSKRCAAKHRNRTHRHWCEEAPDVPIIHACPYKIKFTPTPVHLSVLANMTGRSMQREEGLMYVNGREVPNTFELIRPSS